MPSDSSTEIQALWEGYARLLLYCAHNALKERPRAERPALLNAMLQNPAHSHWRRVPYPKYQKRSPATFVAIVAYARFLCEGGERPSPDDELMFL